MSTAIKLAELMRHTDISYNATAKKEFQQLCMKFLNELKPLLELKECFITFNKAGIAVSGEAFLMGMWTETNGIYINIEQGSCGPIMYRNIRYMKDYTGGHNNWFQFSDMTNIKDIANKILIRKKFEA